MRLSENLYPFTLTSTTPNHTPLSQMVGVRDCSFNCQVRVESSPASQVWFSGMEGTQFGVWVAHGEGRCHFPDKAVFETVKKQQLVPLRYIDDAGEPTCQYPFNPNGSPEGIVGLCSADGRHLAMMPHPERLTVWPWQWPYTPEDWVHGPNRLRASPWLKLFQNVRVWCDSTSAANDK